MKFDIATDMLFELLNHRKLTAQYFAQKYKISVRTVFRYVDVLSLNVPVETQSGRTGGIYISDAYKLPVGLLSKEEYEAADEALEAMYSQLPEERFLNVRKKLAAQRKTDEKQLFFSGEANYLLIDSGSWGDSKSLSEKIRLFENAAKNREVIEIDYVSREGKRTVRKTEPHILIYKQNVWYVYAFCRMQQAFRLFRIGRVYSAFLTGETFTRREITRDDIPLHYWDSPISAPVKLEVKKSAYADVQDWLGCENLRPLRESEGAKNGAESEAENATNAPDGTNKEIWIAETTLPVDDVLAKKILSLGAGVKVLEPAELQKKTAELAAAVAEVYS